MSTLAELGTKTARMDPGAPAFIDAQRGVARSFGALSGRIHCLAVSLCNMFAPHQRIAVLSRTSIEMVELYLACAASGSLLFPLDPRQSTARLARSLLYADPVAVFYDSAYQVVIDELRSTVKARAWIAWQPGSDSGYEELLSRAAGPGANPGKGPVRGLSALPNAGSLRDRPFAALSTSAVSPHPTGAVHTQHSFAANVFSHLAAARVAQNDVYLMLGELSDVYGCIPLAYLAMGRPVVIADVEAWDLATLIDQEKVSSLFAPAAVLSQLVDSMRQGHRRLPSLRQVEYCGMPAAEQIRDAADVFAADLLRAWGTPELGLGTHLGPSDHRAALAGIRPQRLRSYGRSSLLGTLEVLDGNGCPVNRDDATVGEICRQVPGGMVGYWNNREQTAAKLRGGWVHSGNLGTWDAEGYIYTADQINLGIRDLVQGQSLRT